jgi:hypothetical protein
MMLGLQRGDGRGEQVALRACSLPVDHLGYEGSYDALGR